MQSSGHRESPCLVPFPRHWGSVCIPLPLYPIADVFYTLFKLSGLGNASTSLSSRSIYVRRSFTLGLSARTLIRFRETPFALDCLSPLPLIHPRVHRCKDLLVTHSHSRTASLTSRHRIDLCCCPTTLSFPASRNFVTLFCTGISCFRSQNNIM